MPKAGDHNSTEEGSDPALAAEYVTCQEAARLTGHYREDVSRWAFVGRIRSYITVVNGCTRRMVCLDDVRAIPTRRKRQLGPHVDADRRRKRQRERQRAWYQRHRDRRRVYMRTYRDRVRAASRIVSRDVAERLDAMLRAIMEIDPVQSNWSMS